LGCWNLKTTVTLSGVSTFIGTAGVPVTNELDGAGVSVLLVKTLSYHHLKSALVNGLPSDHFIPLRSLNVHSVALSFTTQDSAMRGCSCKFLSYQTKLRSIVIFDGPRRSDKPLNARRIVPPYLPGISSVGITSGFSGKRCATAGNLPALTSSASCGDSLNVTVLGAGVAVADEATGAWVGSGAAVGLGKSVGLGALVGGT